MKISDIILHRVLIALIRRNGKCPCPRCLVLKSNIPMMGGKRDLKARVTSERRGSTAHGRIIESARNLVYQKNYAVNSLVVDRITTGMSLVPTRVSIMRATYE